LGEEYGYFPRTAIIVTVEIILKINIDEAISGRAGDFLFLPLFVQFVMSAAEARKIFEKNDFSDVWPVVKRGNIIYFKRR
jgi:hypothetical protein